MRMEPSYVMDPAGLSQFGFDSDGMVLREAILWEIVQT